MASYYDFAVMEWYVTYPDGRMELGICPKPLLKVAGTDVFTTALNLTAVSGLIQTPGGVDWYASAAKVGGLTNGPVAAGTTTPLTLTLDVAGVEGTYNLRLLNGRLMDESGDSVPLADGESFTITVGSE